MTLTPLFTITLSVISSLFFVFAVYGIHTYLVPYRSNSRYKTEPTLPMTEKVISPTLRTSLYSLPAINYLDPRNSLINYDLRNSRWSTSVIDLYPDRSKHSPTSSARSSVFVLKTSKRSSNHTLHKQDKFSLRSDSQYASLDKFRPRSSDVQYLQSSLTTCSDSFGSPTTRKASQDLDFVDHRNANVDDMCRYSLDSTSESLKTSALWLQALILTGTEAVLPSTNLEHESLHSLGAAVAQKAINQKNATSSSFLNSEHIAASGCKSIPITSGALASALQFTILRSAIDSEDTPDTKLSTLLSSPPSIYNPCSAGSVTSYSEATSATSVHNLSMWCNEI